MTLKIIVLSFLLPFLTLLGGRNTLLADLHFTQCNPRKNPKQKILNPPKKHQKARCKK